MDNTVSISRRHFLKNAATTVAAVTVLPRFVLGGKGYISPSDKIRLGLIGTGKLSYGLMRRFVPLPLAEMVAACDVFKSKLENFKNETESFIKEETGKSKIQIDTYQDYRELLERNDIDAVIIATPDHWHAIQSIDAMRYGKDVYCEKPLSHTIEEGRTMVNTARNLDKIVQTGSMQRSWENFRKACTLVRNGYIGELKEIWVSVEDPPVPYNLEGQPVPEGLDWDFWLGPAPNCDYHEKLAPPLNKDFWPRWRDYEEFGGGNLADWGAHMFDIAQWGMGTDFTGPVKINPPENAAEKRGLTFEYKNGVKVIHKNFDRGYAVRFIGKDGKIDISRQFFDSKPKKIVDIEMKESDIQLYHSDNHYGDWLNCIKTRRLPVADVEIGHRSASLCYLAAIGYKLNRTLSWNPELEIFPDDYRANMLLTKDYRAPWSFDKYKHSSIFKYINTTH
jgi:predicted dehydrogenase